MDIEKYLKSYSDSKTHSSISKLTDTEKNRVKNLIDEVTTQTKREFEISEINVLSDRIEISLNYQLTMFR
ncbi:hypothetical protein EON73_00390 [bacterium]|nr:MAG: hypothetical protein EON73_00390 [bacterium]